MLKKILFNLLLLTIITTVYAENKPNMASVPPVVNDTIKQFMQENDVPGVAVELYVDGKPSAYYFGERNKEKHKPVTGRTIFELGSITKLMTSLLLAEEIDSAKLQLDHSVTDYLPKLASEYEDITLMNLATHTSGLPFLAPKSIHTSKTLRAYLQQWHDYDAAEERWQYSNFGMQLLAAVIERTEHRDMDTLYRQRIFNRLKMQPIGLHPDKAYRPYYAQGYDELGMPVAPLANTDATPAGGMRAMPIDMQRFLRAAIGLPGTPERVLYPMRMTQSAYVTTTQFMQGLGWEVHAISDRSIPELLAGYDVNLLQPKQILNIQDKPTFDRSALIDKTGATSGFRSYIAVIPGKQTGIVILANKYVSGAPIAQVGRKILFALNDIKVQHTEDEDVPALVNHFLSVTAH